MEFFNDIGKKFSSVAKSVSEKTKDSVEVTHISSDLRGLKGDLEQLYTQLGKVCYAVRMGEGDADEAEQLAGRIQKTLARIEELTAQRDAIRDVRRCQSCGAVMPREARFCSNCGKRMPEDAPDPEPGLEPAEFCPDCGAQRTGGERFCQVCGMSFEEAEAAADEAAPIRPEVEMDVEEPAADGDENRE